MREIAIIGVPSSAGARQTGQEKAPQAYREAGLTENLGAAGLHVTDFGDLPEVSFQPDPQHPKAQNLQLVVDVAQQVGDRVDSALRENALPMVLGGDCTITFGVVAAMIKQTPNLGLLYFDGDLDLNSPETTLSGIFDGMVMAHMIGIGADALVALGPRTPLMAEEDVVLFGYNPEAGAIDAVEMELLPQRRMLKYPVSEIRGKAKKTAREALSHLEKRVDSILVHFDVDVIDYEDFPVGDLPHYHGLSFAEAMSALEVLVQNEKFGGLVITEFNADRDVEGKHARRFVEAIAEALEEKRN